jgi:hypothetical protein
MRQAQRHDRVHLQVQVTLTRSKHELPDQIDHEVDGLREPDAMRQLPAGQM